MRVYNIQKTRTEISGILKVLSTIGFVIFPVIASFSGSEFGFSYLVKVVLIFGLLPYWLGYLIDPNPDKGFLLKRWKL